MKFIIRQVPLNIVNAVERAVKHLGAVTTISPNGDGTALLDVDIRDAAIESLVNAQVKNEFSVENRGVHCPRLEIEE